ncbi:uncharacterized protein [Dysidea avara]|uniref:uncharacterized protein n=1 Tax=Dysidea avara TaxID=196820 RepID=UPI003331F11B
MSFSVESFVDSPKLSTLVPLKKADLSALAQHYKLEITSTMKKSDIRRLLVEHLVEEEIVSDDEDSLTSANVVELKKLELKDKEKERESQLKLKKMELKERDLTIQLKIKELELAAATATASPTPRRSDFDVSKHVRFVPPFQETEVDKYFLHFEKVASSLSWPREVWTLLLQSALLGKAREAYSALSVDQSSEYDTVKSAVLRAYELVPEAYRQKFRNSRKNDSQTYVEFARSKETLFDRWCVSKEVQKEFGKLRQLVLMEEFKNCLPTDIKTYLKIDTLHPPIKQHPYRLHPSKLAALRKEVQYMLKRGIVERSQSEWSSSCVLVPKADGSYRFCTDFRKVNTVTKSDSFPLPRVEDCIDSVGHSRYITKFDLLKGYW